MIQQVRTAPKLDDLFNKFHAMLAPEAKDNEAYKRLGASLNRLQDQCAAIIHQQNEELNEQELNIKCLQHTVAQYEDRVRRLESALTHTKKKLEQSQDTNKAPTMNEPKAEASMMQKIAASKAVATLKVDASEAGWRIAGSQFIKSVKEPLIALLCSQIGPGDEMLRIRIASFLDTELGTAILAACLSAGLSAIPSEPNALPSLMARELRVRSIAGAGDALANVLMGPLREVAVAYLQAPVEYNAPAKLSGGNTTEGGGAQINTVGTFVGSGGA